MLDELRLRDVAAADRLDELGFELPLVGGDTPTGTLGLGRHRLAARRRTCPPATRWRGYAERLRDPLMRLGPARLPDRNRSTSSSAPAPGDGARPLRPRRLQEQLARHRRRGSLSAWHYRPAALAEAMQRAHYPLQALLYLAALHRYLRGRLPGYDAERHLAGVLYLFLRGMTGPDTPRVDGQPCGVFAWRPPTPLVEALSDLLDRGGAASVSALDDGRPNDARLVQRAAGIAARVQRGRRAGRRRRPRRPPARATRRRSRTRARCSRPRSPCARPGSAPSASTSPRSAPPPRPTSSRRSTCRRCPGRNPQTWVESLAASPLVAAGEDGGDDRPLRLVGTTLYLDRYWRDERSVAADLLSRNAPAAEVDTAVLADGLARLFAGDEPDLQRLAAATCVLRRLAVVGGGPGTGKTTTVTRILVLLDEQADAAGAPPPLVALAAPTGKAAAASRRPSTRRRSTLELSEPERERLLETRASTLHRLLGWRPGSTNRFRHDRRNQLPHDVVIVDETSMVSLSLMARLLEAVRDDARLILVGDPRQLASVEAGAVLGDLVGPAADALLMREPARSRLAEVARQTVPATEPPAGVTIGDGIVVLRRVHRFAGAIAELAEAVRGGDAEAALAVLRAGHDDVRWIDVDVAERGAREALAPGPRDGRRRRPTDRRGGPRRRRRRRHRRTRVVPPPLRPPPRPLRCRDLERASSRAGSRTNSTASPRTPGTSAGRCSSRRTTTACASTTATPA